MSEAKPAPSAPDPLIDEVRQRRRDLFEACGRDLARLAELIRAREAEHPDKVSDPRGSAVRQRTLTGGE